MRAGTSLVELGNCCADLRGEMQEEVQVPTWMNSGKPFRLCCMAPLRSRYGPAWGTRFASTPTPQRTRPLQRRHRWGKWQQ
eukprot:887295-Prorocentrum_lima.AAC.1